MIHDIFDMTNGALNDHKVPIMRFELFIFNVFQNFIHKNTEMVTFLTIHSKLCLT